jgi:glycosyltransferase involved in cell wall biosynthesis
MPIIRSRNRDARSATENAPEVKAGRKSSEARIRVLHLASVINHQDFIDTIVRYVDNARFAPMACTFSKASNIRATQYEGLIPSFTLDVRGRRDYPCAILRLAAILRKNKVDILHAHHYDEALMGAAAVTLVSNCRLVIGRHYHDEVYLLSRWLQLWTLLGMESLANRIATRIVVPSSVIRTLMIERQSVSNHKIEVIPYGFEFEGDKYQRPEPARVQRIRADFGLEGRFLVGNFGRQHRLKGQEYLLRGFASFARRHSDAALLMVGDGPHGPRLRHLAEELGLAGSGQVIFTGWRKDSWKFLEAVDVVVHGTLHEALPQLMIEAMAQAKPLVITNVSGACDHARHLDNAYVIESRSAGSIDAALEWIRSHPEAARSCGERGYEYVRRELSIQRIIPRFEELYEKIA